MPARGVPNDTQDPTRLPAQWLRGIILREVIMAAQKTVRKDQSDAGRASNDVIEQKVVALAEQLGWFLGTVQAKAEGWLDREALRKEVGRIRDGAVELLDHVNRASAEARKAAATPGVRKTAASPSVAPTMRASRGAVDAPGKRHRKPPPQERLDKRMGEPVGKKMGQKGIKNRMRSGRG